MAEKQPIPFLLGLRAAKANLIPGLLVQTLMVGVVVAYYYHPATKEILNSVAEIKARSGVLFSIAVAALAGGVLPEALKITFFQKGRMHRQNLLAMLLLAPFWGFQGWMVDVLYRFQSFMFGNGVDAGTIAAKVFFDQFLFNPVFAAPLNCMYYDLLDRGFTPAHFRNNLQRNFVTHRIFPTLLATWGYWVPMAVAIYALPPLLQVPLFALALTFWTLILAYMNSRHKVENPTEQPTVAAEVG